MCKWKTWLYDKFLPAWCRSGLEEENARLTQLASEQRQEIERLNAYISGMEYVQRRQRVVIQTGGAKL